MTFKIPAGVLAQHLAVLGKTGSGKTSTAKLCVEQVVDEGARVCVLDPIKSDWWGLISSANGERAGLPFQILGGPRGHVPLHDGAGKAIGEVVANGALPLSIIDMADFAPGGQARFFVDFAPTLIRKMRGVIYLVIEEAHLFAPKERSGVGAENMSIHWAKTLATAGRSKGIRLILVTQRTQALHNALLGSCETMIAHRLSAPADQEPVLKWLKANTTKEITAQVSTSLASLPTGEGWICSGEAKVFQRVKFPRIKTYDNSATPTGDSAIDQVKTAPVDSERLRSIIGDAVKNAEANDPAVLKRRIAELERQMKVPPTASAIDTTSLERRSFEKGFAAASDSLAGIRQRVLSAANDFVAELGGIDYAPHLPEFAAAALSTKIPHQDDPKPGNYPVKTHLLPATKPPYNREARVSRPQQKILDQLAWLESMGLYPAPTPTLAAVCRVSPKSSSYQNNVGALRTAGLLEKARGDGLVSFTDRGRIVAAEVPLTTRPIHEHWFEIVSRPQRAILETLVKFHAQPIAREFLAEELKVSSSSSSFENNLGALRSLGAIDYPERGMVHITRYVMP